MFPSALDAWYVVDNTLTGFARMPPKLAVSYPKSMSPANKQKQEKSSIGVIKDHEDWGFAINVDEVVDAGNVQKQSRCKVNQ